jgi:CheY-like chemotaxis protein
MAITNRLKEFTLVIADDDEINRVVLIHIVKELNLPIVEATNGAEALQVIERIGVNKPVVLLLDLNMPFMSGYDVIDAIEANRHKYQQVKTIVVSGTLYSNFKQTGKERVILSYVEKPINYKELIQKIMLATL